MKPPARIEREARERVLKAKAKRKRDLEAAKIQRAEDKARRLLETGDKKKPANVVHIPGWTPKNGHAQPPPHVKTPESAETVEMLAGNGITQSEIAEVLDINNATLWKHYREELVLGFHRANMAVASNLFAIATRKDGGSATVQAAIWWTKARMGWSEIRRVAADVRTVQTSVRDMTDAELIQIIERNAGGDSVGGALPAPEIEG